MAPRATVGILSIGDMGAGIARLLIANNFKAVTNISGRSETTQTRAQTASIHLVHSDIDLCVQSDYVLSIVPPGDALATAQRIALAVTQPSFPSLRQAQNKPHPLYFLDLNAISPSTSRTIASLFASSSSDANKILYIDGGIIGGPPKPPAPDNSRCDWTRLLIPLSGPHTLESALPAGSALASTLRTKHISPEIGSASGLKMCFASLTKGFTALAIQSYTTAYNLDVLEDLTEAMREFNPNGLEAAEKGLRGMPAKAGRWVAEMREIERTFGEEGGFEAEEGVFSGVAGVFGVVALETELGERSRKEGGFSGRDVAVGVSEGLRARKMKVE